MNVMMLIKQEDLDYNLIVLVLSIGRFKRSFTIKIKNKNKIYFLDLWKSK